MKRVNKSKEMRWGGGRITERGREREIERERGIKCERHREIHAYRNMEVSSSLAFNYMDYNSFELAMRGVKTKSDRKPYRLRTKMEMASDRKWHNLLLFTRFFNNKKTNSNSSYFSFLHSTFTGLMLFISFYPSLASFYLLSSSFWS